MRIGTLYGHGSPVLSIEVFPPKTERGQERLFGWLKAVEGTEPGFVSVTYGAGGSTQQGTHEICAHIKRNLALECMAHLTCVTHTRGQIAETLENLRTVGVENLMALRGDPPAGITQFKPPVDGFAHAIDLVREAKRAGTFDIGVAGYPEGHVEAVDFETDLAHQVAKAKAGANLIVSQFFLDNQAFLDWRVRLRQSGVTQPIAAGILPAQSLAQIERFAGFCGVMVPPELAERLRSCGEDDAAAARVGLEHAIAQVRGLLAAGVDGIHLYALNKMEPVEAIAPLMRHA